MAGLQQFYFFPTDFLDTIKDHPSLPLDAKEDQGKSRKSIIALRDSVDKLNENYKKISSDSLPTRVVPLKKSKKKIDM
ncbi:hypothetical protein HanPI659440_Chr06g0235081 [Helianthus annuus]|nr:hypothetical protein HanIR_Chr06g0277651 [Helianthus annuus]KAJ0780212.1 hypothetical protein HanPI659440_Chr06g0235081 [Helianthus annuus]